MPSLPSPRGRTRPRLEIIPFIDVMFFLLATFMMVSLSMTKNDAIPVSLPQAATGGEEDRRESVAVSVTEYGLFYLDKERMALSEIRGRLRSLVSKNPDLKVFVNADERADFGLGVKLFDEVRAAGVKKVFIQTTKAP